MAELPAGFVLDEPTSGGGSIPAGFVLDQPSFGSEAKAVAGNFGGTMADMASFIDNVNPMQLTGPKLWGLNPLAEYTPDSGELLRSGMEAVGLDPQAEAQTGPGKVASGVANALPMLAIPEMGLVSTLNMGLASGLTDAAGGDDTAQMIAGLAAGISPSVIGRTVEKAASSLATRSAEDVLGIKPNNITQSVKRGVQFLDEAGKPVSSTDATDFTSRLESRVEDIRKSPVWKKLSNNPKKSYIAVSSEIENLNKAKDAMAATVDDGLNVLKEQHGLNVKIQPNWQIAEDYIQNGKGTAGVKKSLNKQLANIKADWESKNGTFQDLIAFKSEVNTGKTFPNGPTGAASSKLREKILLGIKDSSENVANAILPEQGAFAKTNSALSDLLNIKELLATKAANSPNALGRAAETLKSVKNVGVGVTGALLGQPATAGSFLFGEALTKAFPKTAEGIFSKTASVFGKESAKPSVFSGAAAMMGASRIGSSKDRSQESIPREMKKSSKSSSDNTVEEPKSEQQKNDLLDAIRQVESGGGKYLKSKAGAEGPYQFMPKTAKAYGLKDPYNEKEARAAAHALITDEFKALGSIELALAAYNAGRPAVLNAIKKAGSVEWNEVKNYLPEETQNYIPKIEKQLGKLTKV